MWNLIVTIWNSIVVEPILNLITVLTALIPGHNFGLALIVFTILMRLLLYPVIKKQLIQIRKQRELQPEVNKIKKAYKGNRQGEALATMALYKEKGFNPFAVLLYLMIQIPIFIGLYQTLRHINNNIVNDNPTIIVACQSQKPEQACTWSFVENLPWLKDLESGTATFDSTFVGILDLTKPAVTSVDQEQGSGYDFYLGAFLVVLAAVAVQVLTTRQTMIAQDKTKKPMKFREILQQQQAGKEVDQSEIALSSSRIFTYLLPFLTFIIFVGWFAALPFYWLVNGLLQYFQQRRLNKDMDAQTTQATVNGKAEAGVVEEKPLNAKQKKQQAQQAGRKKSARKQVTAEVKTIQSKNKGGQKK